jgi:crotonobetainyl-CoA:carnitine CoA-transferase CaiB-like acyl-CoA transferase
VNLGTNLAPLFGATAALAALSWSRRTGRPVFLDVAQADAAAFANLAIEDQVAEQRSTAAGLVSAPPAPPQDRGGMPTPRPATQCYRTRDGKMLLLMALERKFFVRLTETVGRPDLLVHVPENQYLAHGNKEIDDALVEIISSRDLSEWMQIFAAADVPVVPVHESSQVLDDPHLSTRIEWLDADQGTVTMKTPVRSEPSIASPEPAPAIGQHTTDVLTLMGVDQAEIDRLTHQGVIRIAPETRATE